MKLLGRTTRATSDAEKRSQPWDFTVGGKSAEMGASRSAHRPPGELIAGVLLSGTVVFSMRNLSVAPGEGSDRC